MGVAQSHNGDYTYLHRWWTTDEEANGKDALFRANDGAVDSRGRLWASVMNDPLTTTVERNGIGVSLFWRILTYSHAFLT